MSKEVCQRCGEYDYDTRTLWMSCMYAMDELGLPFAQRSFDDPGPARFFTLTVCKDCRGSWMDAIKHWFERGHEDRESCGSGIFVRRYGANVEISREEWDSLNPGREPVLTTPKDKKEPV